MEQTDKTKLADMSANSHVWGKTKEFTFFSGLRCPACNWPMTTERLVYDSPYCLCTTPGCPQQGIKYRPPTVTMVRIDG
jgi:hypothetical protein